MNGIRLVKSEYRKKLHCVLCGCQYAKYILPATAARNYNLVVCDLCFFKCISRKKGDDTNE